MKQTLLNALEARYEADIQEADAVINIYLSHSVGIGEHPQHLEEINKLLQKIADAKEKLEIIKDFESEKQVL